MIWDLTRFGNNIPALIFWLIIATLKTQTNFFYNIVLLGRTQRAKRRRKEKKERRESKVGKTGSDRRASEKER